MMFGRKVTLQIGQPDTVGRSFTDLRIAFRVDMTRDATPNSASILAYNLSPESIALIQRPGSVVRLLAGYDVPRLVFVGDPIRDGVRLEKRGPDRILSIEAQDGGNRYRATRVHVSFATDTTVDQVFEHVAEQMGLPTGYVRIDRLKRFPSGVVLSGDARDVLDRIATMSGADWTITDGTLNVIPKGEASGEPAVKFSTEQGNLIGSPSKMGNGGVEIVGLLEPALRPGRSFVVKSSILTGAYVATEVSFVGDSGFDNPYYTIATGVPR